MKAVNVVRGIGLTLVSGAVFAANKGAVPDGFILKQRQALQESTIGRDVGPQSPRDIDKLFGRNFQTFAQAPASNKMNLCNIHFHKNAEHKGGDFTQYAGNGDGLGFQTGDLYSGQLTLEELKPVKVVLSAKANIVSFTLVILLRRTMCIPVLRLNLGRL